ncbi:MAG TPA: hypothetical protein VIK74_00170, partial [Parasegetibacter sp.]
MSSEPSRAQKPDSYATMWKKVDSLLKQAGLPGSALTEINKIYSLAKKEKNQPQLIKAISYKAAINDENEEDGDILNIKMLEKEIADLPQPGKSILYSITAERYWNYFQNNRWKLYSRTETSDKVSDNITTWGPEDFHKKITAYYDASLSASDLLYKTPVNNFDTILAIGNVRHLRPTLFDLLCFRALKYFESDELTITRPKDRFTLSAPQAFSPAADFVNHEFSSTDSLSNHLKALKLYQRLLKLHLNDKEPDALIDADLNRLGFVNIYSTHPQSDSLYISAVRKIADKYQQLPAAAQAWYLIADDHAQKASLYDPLSDTTHRYEYLKAIKICEEVLKQKDSSEGKTNCMILLQNIKEQSLELTTEKVNLPDQAFRTLVSYKNVGKIYVRIIPVTKEMINHLGNAYEDKYWASLVSLKPIKTYTHNLPATGDYQRHYTEIATDGLPVGEYAFLVSSDQDFNFVTAPAAVHFFHVSAISYIHKDDNYYVLHRETGKPLGNAAVEVYTRVYNYGTQKEELRRLGTYYTNAQGYVKLDRINGKSSQPIQLAIRHEKDFLHLNDTRYSVTRNNGFDSERKEEIKTYLFTDRSIYRPGQTV